MFESSFLNHASHLEGEEVFGFAKQLANYPFGVDHDFHHHDNVNFSRPRITIPVVEPNIVEDVGMHQPPFCSSIFLSLVS
jgi:hypothetical protein